MNNKTTEYPEILKQQLFTLIIWLGNKAQNHVPSKIIIAKALKEISILRSQSDESY